jgi:hypothetical protein
MWGWFKQSASQIRGGAVGRLVGFAAVLGACALIGGVVAPTGGRGFNYNSQVAWQYFWAFALGGAVGAGELIGRFRAASWGTLATYGALIYVAVNAAAAGAALWFILFNPFGGDNTSILAGNAAGQVLVAGLGAIALLPLAQFKMQVAGAEITIGPARFVTTLLDAALDQTGKESAVAQARNLLTLKDFDPDRFAKQIMPVCLELIETLSKERRDEIAKELTDLAGNSDSLTYVLRGAVHLSQTVGWEVIRVVDEIVTTTDEQRKKRLREQLAALASPPPPPPHQ